MNEAISKFTEELKVNQNVSGIILFGSWARGNNFPDSDADLLVVLKAGEVARVPEYRDGQAFEITYTTEPLAVEFWNSHTNDCFNLWEVAKVLCDKDGTVERLKAEAEKIIAKGKKPLADAQLKHLKFDAEDELKSVERLVEKDAATASLVLNKKILNFLELYFDIKQLWTPAPKQTLAKIREVNSEMYDLIVRFYSDRLGLIEKIALVKDIAKIIFS